MTPEAAAAFTFTDFHGLAALKRDAARETPEAKRAVAQQFESLFLGLVLKEMRAAGTVGGGLFDGDGVRFYQDLYDRQLALALARGPGIGLADAIYRELGGEPAARDAAGGAQPASLDAAARTASGALGHMLGGAPGRDVPRAPFGAAAPADASHDALAASPEAFVATLRPHAERAAEALGVDADVLIAQAALETGWGRHVIRAADGRSTFNLFGIKATGGWRGPRASVPTLEFVGGLPERRNESFRVYASIAESFDDYVALVRGSGRYRGAVGAETPETYVRALAAGGYSTDPAYADKVLAILERGLPGTPLKPERGPADTRLTAGRPPDDRPRGGST
ncbi:MAG TPA: flagellar assembly peptidoglycan hydrolase FlgJ [Gammaproteobacteria bacterium]